jgi:hypothetical protein
MRDAFASHRVELFEARFAICSRCSAMRDGPRPELMTTAMRTAMTIVERLLCVQVKRIRGLDAKTESDCHHLWHLAVGAINSRRAHAARVSG